MKNALLFDIHRFSLNDGPGIRTTVFLKGCSLKCEWCHNPESQSFKPELSYNPDKCINCFDCVNACPNHAHTVSGKKHFFRRELCTLEGECVKVCTAGALKLIGYNQKVDDIINIVLKDFDYFKRSGGGLTISGGEPMAQFGFTKEILTAAKENNIHTCIDTCGIAQPQMYKEIIPLVDLFLFDYKITDSEEHKAFTGAGNELILENLELLYTNGANIILRCPVIPGINDNKFHFEGIISLMKKYPDIKEVQLMPYHTMGRDKCERIGREYTMTGVPDATEDDKQKWTSYFLKKNFRVKCN